MSPEKEVLFGVDVQTRGLAAVVLDQQLKLLDSAWLTGSSDSVSDHLLRLVELHSSSAGRVAVGMDSPRRPLKAPRPWYWNRAKGCWRARGPSDRGHGRHCEVVLAALGLANPQWTQPASSSPDWMKLGFAAFDRLASAGLPAFEVFPTASYRQLAGENVVFSMSTRGLADGPKDLLDARIAAITVREFLAGHGGSVSGGDGLGEIILPRPADAGPMSGVLN
jgi:hypothetical protein